MLKRCIFLLPFFFSALCWAQTPLEQSLAEHIHYRSDQRNLVGYLSIPRDRPIDQSTYLHVKFALEDYVKRGVSFIILQLNTPGGEVFPAMKIAELLQEVDTVHHIPVVAVVNHWALSAGAMLAYSCRYIAVSQTALMGAAEPVMSSGEGKMESAPEKIVSALRAEFSSLAKFYGRNPLLAEAMVDKDSILVRRKGEIIKLQNASEIKASDVMITPGGKLLTLDAEQLLHFKVADMMLSVPVHREVSAEQLELGEWPLAQNPLFSAPFFSKIPQAMIVNYRDWKIDFFSFLTHPLVASLLMMGLILGIYAEMSHPGFGVPGVMALTCLGFILMSNFATEAIGWLEILLVVFGILLLLTEIFILPGFGVIGILGILLILFGLVAGMLPDIRSIDFSWDMQQWSLQAFEFFYRLLYITSALVLSLVAIALFTRFVTPRLLKRSRLVLQGDQEGSVAGLETASLPLAGAEGEVCTTMHPGGKVRIENNLYDAIAETNYIEKGEKVVVVKIQGSAIIVAKKI
jgi:membrane-bound ClpP family serine protease